MALQSLNLNINLDTDELMKSVKLFNEQIRRASDAMGALAGNLYRPPRIIKNTEIKVVVKPWKKPAVPIMEFMEGR